MPVMEPHRTLLCVIRLQPAASACVPCTTRLDVAVDEVAAMHEGQRRQQLHHHVVDLLVGHGPFLQQRVIEQVGTRLHDRARKRSKEGQVTGLRQYEAVEHSVRRSARLV